MQLTPGDYGTPEAVRVYARRRFMQMTADLAPQVLGTLHDDVLPLPVPPEHATNPVLARDMGGETAVATLPPELQALRSKLDAWADSHRLNVPWIRAAAALQLVWWRQHPEQLAMDLFSIRADVAIAVYKARKQGMQPAVQPRGLLWSNLSLTACGSDDGHDFAVPVFAFEHEGWDPMWTTRKDATAAIEAAFREELRVHLDVMEAAASAAGFERQKKYGNLRQHLEWLVRYQCNGESYSGIARTVAPIAAKETPRMTVSKPVRELAEVLELPLRQYTGGRPRKTRNLTFPR